MKHYLLTWYGITDLRAALGLEPTDGPILSALKIKKYTDVVILAYTNPNKSSQGFAGELRAKWEKWRTSDLETRLQIPRDKAQQSVDALSNTESGHMLFADWLKTELATNGVSCNIQVISRELRHLNDAQAIFDAAAFAVSHALADTSEKTITAYVSPGTPVMAYTWALIARAHPQHNIAVIASSNPRNPPETVELPKDLLMPVVAGPQTAKPSEYDAIIHLLGRERIPIYFGMLQFKAGLHVFITTQDYQHAGNVLSRCLPEACQSKTVTIQDAFKPADTRRAIEKQVSKLPSTARVAVNLTGGTKLMFAGALAACWERGLEPFYFEINNHNIIFIRDGVTVPFNGAKSVDEFFVVNGFDVITAGRWQDNPGRAARMDITKELWEARRTLGQLYMTPEFRNYRLPWGKRRNPPFGWKWGKSQASFTAKGDATLVLNGESCRISACDDYGQYLGGGWLEEYVCSLLRELEERGVIHDVRIGLEVNYSGKSQHFNEPPSGECDCVFTDGKRLWLVECKAGNVKQEHIQKLENNLKIHGGIAARGILVSAFPIHAAHAKRLKSSTSICAIQADDVRAEVLERIIKS
ncbi:MAG: DUF1887 family CARF protein [Hyphomicrobium sp.]|uniref:Card1-like endonuclease domain-containing protein n=1 Tax=Hyphomicrobium sp. TaxID=82 RepID=UPI0035668241